jgi:hypothetical protein
LADRDVADHQQDYATLREAWHANRRWMVPGVGIPPATVALLGGLLARRQAIGGA